MENVLLRIWVEVLLWWRFLPFSYFNTGRAGIPYWFMKDPTPPVLYPDPHPELPIERGPEGKGVGNWVPCEKHRLLSEYLNASRFAWKKWKKIGRAHV